MGRVSRPSAAPGQPGPGYRSGIVAIMGRANVGKSTLVNAIAGEKVSIVSDKPQTTRAPFHAVVSLENAQLVLVDTPGLHKPRTLLGQRLNRTAIGAQEGVDVSVLVVDAKAGAGGGDRFVADKLVARHVCVLNKIDGMPRAAVLAQLKAVAGWGFEEYFPVSAKTGAGVGQLVEGLARRLPVGPPLYPEVAGSEGPAGPDAPSTAAPGATVGTGGAFGMGEPGHGPHARDEVGWVAELVREQLLSLTREELPYSIACRVTEWDWPYVRCEILVERESQKGMVIGQGGAVLKRVGTAVRSQSRPGTFLDLTVRVSPDWQQKPEMLDRLGL